MINNCYEVPFIGDLKISFPGITRRPKIYQKKITNMLTKTRIKGTFDSFHNYLLVFDSLLVGFRNPSPLCEKLFAEQTSAWKICYLSDFEYLRLINAILSPFFRDSSAYPIIHWIIFYFDSKTIELTNLSFFQIFRQSW
jgi:hypothetical protein